MLEILMVWDKLITYFYLSLHAPLHMWSRRLRYKSSQNSLREMHICRSFSLPLSASKAFTSICKRTHNLRAKHSSDVSSGMTSGHFKQYHLDHVLFSFNLKRKVSYGSTMWEGQAGHPYLHFTTSWCREGFNLEKSLSHFNIVFMAWVSWIINGLDGNRR